MKREHHNAEPERTTVEQPDSSGDVRLFAAWMGLVMVAFGVAMAGYLFVRIGQVVLDPRSFETQVDRWEFVIRGRTTDAFPQAYETPDRQIIGSGAGIIEGSESQSPAASEPDQAERIAQVVGRIGSKSARPAALLVIILVLMILVRIITAIIHAGIRLAGLAGGEREYMKRILEELVQSRNRSGE